jgi:hypothetical protein
MFQEIKMNGRKSKELRRKAESLTVGMEACTYARAKTVKVAGKYQSQPIKVAGNTTRGVLKQLKKS